MNKLMNTAACIIALLIGASSSAFAQTASLIEIASFGDNPSNLPMHLYVPDNLPAKAPILLAVHYCHGTGPEFFRGSRYGAMADEYGYIIVFPTANSSDMCFDVASPAALKRDGGSDPVSIMSMIDYVIQNYDVDAERIYVTGVSSGAMMTNVMLGLYPDVFKAGVAFAGVPFGCFATTNGTTWNSECASGNITKTAEEWGDLVRNAFPGYTGPRPRVQLWHGSNDEILDYNNFAQAIKQWINIHGISQSPSFTDSPSDGITRTRYGGEGSDAPVEALSLAGVPHNLPVDYAAAVRFFGLDQPQTGSSSSAARSSADAEPSSSSALSSSSAATSSTGECMEVCKWYQDAPRPLCQNQPSGWGWENSQSCIGRSTCEGQPSNNGGIISTCDTSSSSAITVSSLSESASASSILPFSSSSVSSFVESASSSVVGQSSSVATGGQQCNWYGTLSPLCENQATGWGWENNQTCIGADTCENQSGDGGIVGASASMTSSVAATASSVTSSSVCNWFGTNYPMCQSTQSGWGWENEQSCISPATCVAQ